MEVQQTFTQGSTTPIDNPELGSVIYDPSKDRKPVIPEDSPERSTVVFDPETDIQKQKAQDWLRQYIADSKDPRSTEAKINSSLYLSKMLGMEPSEVFNNYDTIVEKWTGKKLDPMSAFASIKNEWDIGMKQNTLAQLRFKQIMGDNSEALKKQIEELKLSMPGEDEVKRSVPVQLLKSAANMLPLMIKGMEQGANRGLSMGLGGAAGAAILGQAGPQALAPEEIFTVPGAFLSLFSVGMVSGSTENIAKAEAGLAYDEMMNLKDSLGNPIDPGIAKTLSLLIGGLNGSIEMIQISKIPGISQITQKMLQKSTRALLLDGGFKQVALRAAAEYGKNIVTESGQEVVQEMVTVAGEELAKEITNRLDDSVFEHVSKEDVIKRLGQTFVESAKAFSVIGLPGTAINAVSDMRQQSEFKTEFKDRIAQIIEEADDKEIETLLKAAKKEEASKFEVTDTSAVAKTDEGKEIGNIEFKTEGDAITISKVTTKVPSQMAVDELVKKIAEKNPGKVLWYDETLDNAPVIRRAIENLNPEIARTNYLIDRVSADLESMKLEKADLEDLKTKYESIDEEELESLTKEEIEERLERDVPLSKEDVYKEADVIDERIEAAESRLEHLQRIKKDQSLLDLREKWQKTAYEYRSKRAADSKLEALKIQAELQFPSFDKHTVDTAFKLISMRAETLGITPENWVDKYLAGFKQMDEKQVQLAAGKAKGGVSFLEDGRAVIHTTEASDFSTFVHEFAHILRKQLTDDQLKTAAEWAGEKDIYNWSREGEEKFAEAFEKYIRTGLSPKPELRSIFAKMAEMLKNIYQYLTQKFELSPEIIKVFDSLFDEQIPAQKEKHTNLEQARKAALEAKREMDALALTLGGKYGAEVLNRKEVKRLSRAERKLPEYGGDVSRIVDWNGSTLIFETVDDIARALPGILKDVDLVRAKNRIIHTPASGYKDVLLNIRLQGGHIAELQLNTAAMIEAKKAPVGHDFYELITILRDEAEKHRNDEYFNKLIDAADKLEQYQREYYEKFYTVRDAETAKRLASSSEITTPSVNMVENMAELASLSSPLGKIFDKVRASLSKTYGMYSHSKYLFSATETTSTKSIQQQASEDKIEDMLFQTKPGKKENYLDIFGEEKEIKNFIEEENGKKEKALEDLKEKNPSLIVKMLNNTVERADRVKRIADSILHGNDVFRLKDQSTGDFVILHRSSRAGYKWQISFFDQKGPYSHANANDIVSLINEMEMNGRYEPGEPNNNKLFFPDPNEYDFEKDSEELSIAYGSNEEADKIVEEVQEQLELFKDLPGEFYFDENKYSDLTLGEPWKKVAGEWRKNRRIDFTGKEVRGPGDLAQLFSVASHPRLEHFHIILVNDNDEIVAHNTLSSGLVGSTVAVEKRNVHKGLYRMEERMKKTGATGYYLLHNHPSGKINPSNEDVQVTMMYSDKIKGFKGHIIIDHGKYSLITDSRIIENIEYGQKDAAEKRIQLKDKEEVALLGTEIINSGVKSSVIITNRQLEVVSWNPLHPNKNYSAQAIHQFVKDAGGLYAFIVTSNNEKYEYYSKLAKENFSSKYGNILDVVAAGKDAKVKSATSEGTIIGMTDPEKYYSGKVKGNFLYQLDDRRDEIKKNVEKGIPVPDEVLDEYKDEEWAREELEKRDKREDQDNALLWLEDEAKDFKTADEFIKYIKAMYAFDDDVNLSDEKWLEDFWAKATNYNPVEDDTWTDSQIDFLLGTIIAKRDLANSAGFHGRILSAASRLQGGRQLTKSVYDYIRNILQNNKDLYRYKLAILYEDPEEIRDAWENLQRIEEEERIRKENTPTREERFKQAKKILFDKKLSKKIESGEISPSEIEGLLSDVKKEIKVSEREIDKLRDRLIEADEKIGKMIRVHDETVSELKDEKRKSSRIEKRLESTESRYKKQLRERTSQWRERRRVAVKKALKKEKERLKKLKEKEKALKDIRQLKEKLARAITRPVPKNVDIEYREQIQAIQDQLDPSFRSKKTIDTWNKRKEYFLKHPEEVDALSPSIKKKLASKSLGEFSIEELQELADEINHLRSVGETKRRLKTIIGTKEIQDIINEAVLNIVNGKPLDPINEPVLGDPETLPDKLKAVYLTTLRPSRIVDALDGGKDFKGILHRVFIDEVNEAAAKEIEVRSKRVKKLHARMEKLGIKPQDLVRKITVTQGGSTFTATLDQVLKIYVNTKNDRNMARMTALKGNNISPALANLFIKELSKKELSFARVIVDDYEENFNRLDEAHMELTNERLERVSGWYSPMDVVTNDYKPHPETLASEMSQQFGIKRGSVNRGMTYKRIDISPEHQRPMRIDGLYSEWLEHSYKQEHYIESAAVVHKMRRVLANKDFRAAIRNHKGGAYLNELEKYVSRVANPNIMWSNDPLSRGIRVVKKNFALAALAFNTVTMLKQLPSIVFYTAYTSPADMLAAFGQLGTGWNKWRKFVEERDPLMLERSTEREIEVLRRNRDMQVQNAIKKLQWAGMKGILIMDKMATTAGWLAVYNHAIRKGMSEKEAVLEARNVTLRTQPASHAKDVSSIFTNELVSTFTMFSNQLNQIWNMMTYDAPAAMKNGNLIKGFTVYGSIVFSTALIWMLSNRDLPDKDEDFWDFMVPFLNYIPLIGPVITQSSKGFGSDNPVFKAADDTLEGIRKMTEGEYEKAAKKTIEGISFGLGLPYVESRRIVKGVKEGHPVSYTLFGGRWFEE